MFGKILHRMIFFELARVFVLALVGITGIMVMAGIVAEATQQGLSPSQILVAIPLLIPSFLPYTIPATTLFATCVVYGRLASDNEILAIKAAGIHLRLVIGPALVLGLLMSGATMALYYRLIPYTHHLLRTSFMNDAEEYLYTLLRKEKSIKRPDLPYSIFVRQVQGRRLQDALFKRRGKNNGYDFVARAQEAELHVEMASKQVAVHMRHCYILEENGKGSGYCQDRIEYVPLASDFGSARDVRPRALDVPALLVGRKEMKADIEARSTEIALAIARKSMSDAPKDLDQHITNLKSALQDRRNKFFSLETELHMRPALSFGCLFFVMVGCPVGIWFGKSDYLSAFITCFLPIVFVYYPLLLCSTNFAKGGHAPASLVLWAANALMGMIALLLFRRLLKH